MNRLDVISEITSRLSKASVKSYVAVAPDIAKEPYIVIRQEDPADTKSKDAIVATRCEVLLIAVGVNQQQVSGLMNSINTALDAVDTEVNDVDLKIRVETPGKVDSDGEGLFWQEVVLKTTMTY